MKTIAILSSVVLAAGCGGNWSNRDLEFLNALPTREELQSKLPTGTSGALSGVGTRQDGLMTGDPSQLYLDTRRASTQFNAILEFVISVIEVVRSLPPTSRTLDSRTWGPWSDDHNPGFEFQVVIKQVDPENFNYVFQHRPTHGDFFDTVTGTFKATANLHKGTGALVINAGAAAAKLASAKDFLGLDSIKIGYVTDAFPVTVGVEVAATAGGPSMLSSIGYVYKESATKAGEIYFAVRTTNPDLLEYKTLSLWLPSGTGQAVLTVTEGNWKGYTEHDCWDAAFNLTYAKQTWPGGMEIGDPTTCATVMGF